MTVSANPIADDATSTDTALDLWEQALPYDQMPDDINIEYVVPGLIPKGEITMISAPPGTYKSYISLFLAEAIGRGGQFATRKCEKHNVLILDRENSRATVGSRRNKVGKLATMSNVRTLTLFTDPPAVDIEVDLATRAEANPELVSLCKKHHPVVIVDSLVDFHPGRKENNPDDMSAFFLSLRGLITAGAAAVIVLHHTPVGDSGRSRGTGAQPAAVTNELLIKKVESSNEKLPTIHLASNKNRDGEPFCLGLQLDFTSPDKVLLTLTKSQSASESENLEKRIIEEARKIPGLSLTRLAEAVGGKAETARKLIAAMIRKGTLLNKGTANQMAIHDAASDKQAGLPLGSAKDKAVLSPDGKVISTPNGRWSAELDPMPEHGFDDGYGDLDDEI